MRAAIPLLLILVVSISALNGAPASRNAEPIDSPTIPTSPEKKIVFQGEEISMVLRKLARQAGITMVISENVEGTATLKLEGKTPLEAIEVIAQAKDLKLEKKGGVYFVEANNRSSANPAEAGKSKASDPADFEEAIAKFEEAIAKFISPGLRKMYDSILDHEAQPETAKKIARSKKALYDALIAEGFTKEEAFRLVLAHDGVSLPDLNQ